MAVKKVESFNIHETPAINQNEFDVETYLNANWGKTKEAVNNNAEELMQVQKDISTLKEDNKTNKSSIDVLEKSNETINKSLEDIDTKDKKQDEDIKANKESIEALQTENIEIKSENERLREDIKSIATIGEASGENIHIEDSSDARCELEIGGNHVQETRKGYNQLKNEGTTQTLNNVTITKKEDETLVVNGTATEDFTFSIKRNIELEDGEQYKLSGCPNGGAEKKYVLTINQYYENQSHFGQDYGDGVNFTYNGSLPINNNIYIRLFKGITYNNLIFKPMIVKGTENKPYEQYGASPSFAYPSSVKAVGDVKNILNMSNAKGGTSGGITCNMIADGSYTYKGTASSKAINIWLLGSYNNKTSIFRLEPGTYYIDGVVLFDGNNVLANPDTAKIFTFINAHDITGVRALDAVLENTYDEIKYPIIAKIDHEIPWVSYDCGYAKLKLQNRNVMPLYRLGEYWKYTDKGIKNTTISSGKDLTKFKLKAGQTIKIGFKLFSKPSQDTTFTWYIDKVANIIPSFGKIDSSDYKLNIIYSRTYTAQKDCEVSCTMWGNSNKDIFEFQMWAEYDSLTEYQRYVEQAYLVDVQQPMFEGDKFIKTDGKWYEKHNWRKEIIDGVNKAINTAGTHLGKTWARYNGGTWDTSKDVYNTLEKIKCTHFKVSDSWEKNTMYGKMTSIGMAFQFMFEDDSLKTIIDVNKVLKAQYDANIPLVVYYLLAEPELIECTEAQSKVLDEIYNKAHTYKNITNISAESSEVNPILSVKYLKDTETEHNKLQTQIDEIKELLSTTETSSLLLDNIQKDLESEV